MAGALRQLCLSEKPERGSVDHEKRQKTWIAVDRPRTKHSENHLRSCRVDCKVSIITLRPWALDTINLPMQISPLPQGETFGKEAPATMHASGSQPLVRVLSSSFSPKSISCTPLFGGLLITAASPGQIALRPFFPTLHPADSVESLRSLNSPYAAGSIISYPPVVIAEHQELVLATIFKISTGADHSYLNTPKEHTLSKQELWKSQPTCLTANTRSNRTSTRTTANIRSLGVKLLIRCQFTLSWQTNTKTSDVQVSVRHSRALLAAQSQHRRTM
ncbi:hypothetical protein KCU93_g122, partial [Aureobasidium melanogenum]